MVQAPGEASPERLVRQMSMQAAFIADAYSSKPVSLAVAALL